MSEPQWWWCRRHRRVERTEERCGERFLLGPYESAEAARNWRERAAARTDAWDEADEEWHSWPGEDQG